MTAQAGAENDDDRTVGSEAEPGRRPLHERSIELTDPRAMRASAHPVRMALIGLGDSELSAAERHLDASVLERYRARIAQWLETRADEPPEWQRATGFGDLSVPLTAAELERLRDDVQALLGPYLGRVTGEDEAPEGARRVELIQFAFPAPDAP